MNESFVFCQLTGSIHASSNKMNKHTRDVHSASQWRKFFLCLVCSREWGHSETVKKKELYWTVFLFHLKRSYAHPTHLWKSGRKRSQSAPGRRSNSRMNIQNGIEGEEEYKERERVTQRRGRRRFGESQVGHLTRSSFSPSRVSLYTAIIFKKMEDVHI